MPFKTPFFFNIFIWVLIGKPQSIKYGFKRFILASNTASKSGRSILTKILENTPEEVEKKPLEEESQIAKPESLPDPSPALVILDLKPPEKEETTISDFMLEFEE